MSTARFHPIVAGASIEGDWFPGTIPTNVVAGEGCVVDSTFCFKHFFSRRPVGLRLGARVTIWRAALSVEEDGEIEIGDDTYLADASLVCSAHLSIGARVLVAGGVTIADADFHPLSPARRIEDTVATSAIGDRARRPTLTARPVVIGDDTWIGPNAAVLKGVSIGAGAVVRPGAVVVRDVPAGVTVAGNPAVAVDG